MRLPALTLAASAALLAFAQAAPAATVAVVGSELRVAAAPGEANALTVVAAGDRRSATLSDSVPLTVGPGCAANGGFSIGCQSATGFTAIRVWLDDGADSLYAAGVPAGLRIFAEGGAGDDSLGGGSADDLLEGGEGDDSLRSGPGRDSLVGDDGSDLVNYDERYVRVTVTIGDGADDGMIGERDYVAGDVERVKTGSGHDLIVGTGAAETLEGGDGADEIHGGGGADRLAGNEGTDKLLGGANGETSDGGPGDDEVHGGAGNDRLAGGDGGDLLFGGDGTDVLDSDLGAGLGTDVLDGGAGIDTVDYGPRDVPVAVSVGDSSAPDGPANEYDDVTGTVERVYGTRHTDELVGYAGAQTLAGREGTDVLEGGADGDTLNGGGGDDEVTGGSGRDTLLGEAGDDRLEGAGDADLLNGGTGADVMFGGTGVDRVTYAVRTAPVRVTLGSRADDGEAGEADYVGSDTEDVLGGRGDDVLTGSAAANVLDGGSGGDVIRGLGGTDTVSYATRNIPVTADIDGIRDDGSSSDGALLAARDDIGTDVENITGGGGNDVLSATAATAVVNTLNGGGGDDRLKTRDGTAAIDRLLCGAGVDQFDKDPSDSISLCETAATLP